MLRSPDYAPLHLRGECDQCHDPSAELFAFEDDEPGDWTYCSPCAKIISLNRRRKLKEAGIAARPRGR